MGLHQNYNRFYDFKSYERWTVYGPWPKKKNKIWIIQNGKCFDNDE